MRHRRWLVVAATVLAMVTASGCDPAPEQMEIQISLHRGGLISQPDGNGLRTIVLTGVAQCTRDEPVDIFPTIQQGAVTDRPGETSVPCGPDRQDWSASFTVDDDLAAGPAQVDIQACTNPAETIDEDCVTAGRVVGLGALP